MAPRRFALIEEEEKERARADAVNALQYWSATEVPDDRELLLRLYGLPTEGAPACFVNSGNILETALLAHPVLVPIFPFDSEAELVQQCGATALELADLGAEGIVIPISQPAMRYERLPFLHPIIELKPKDYFLRAAYFYAIVFDGCVDIELHDTLPLAPSVGRLYDKARTSKNLQSVLSDASAMLREPYDEGRLKQHSPKARRVLENIAYRYASVAVFVGEDVVDYVLENLPPRDGLVALLHLHVAFDHYLTMGLLSTMHDDLGYYLRDEDPAARNGRRWLTNALKRWSYPVVHDQPVTFIPSPSLDEITAVKERGVSLAFPRLTALQDTAAFRAALQTKIAENDDTLRVVCKTRDLIKKTLTATAFTLTAMSGLPGPVTVSLAVASAIIPDELVDVVANEVEKRMRRVGVLRTLNYMHAIWRDSPYRGDGVI